MKGSITAAMIDNDYRRERMYKNKQRNKCKEKPCEQCKAFDVCTEVEEEYESKSYEQV